MLRYACSLIFASVSVCGVGVLSAGPAWADSFSISSGQVLTGPQTLTDGQSGTVAAGGALSLPASDGSVAITVSGNTTIDNAGTIQTAGSGRGIRDDRTNLSLKVVNEAGALLSTADNDTIQLHKGDTVEFDNYGTVQSLNHSEGGAQAIDFNHISDGASNVVNNYSGGLVSAYEADGIRPGVDGMVNNAGQIRSTNAPGSTDSSDGIDMQSNTGGVINNEANAQIEGARHGITGGNTDTSTDGSYALHVTNAAGATIQGDDGSGINIDGFNANELVNVTNHGQITGDGVTRDGDGIDVDGLLDLNNTGSVISEAAAGSETSEGVTVGGGTIVNSGIIRGENPGGASRGVTLAGLDKDPNTGAAIPTEGIFANTSVTNSGTITGDTGAAIAVSGAANDFTVNIVNLAGGVLSGGGDEAAVFTGGNQATVSNYGTIESTGASNAAVDLGSGDSTLNILGGQASVKGDINGGTGNSTVAITPGSGQRFVYHDAISHVSQLNTGAGTVVLDGHNQSIGATEVRGGTLVVGDASNASAYLDSSVSVAHGGTLAGIGSVGSTSISAQGALAPGGNGSVGTLSVNGPLSLAGLLDVDLGGVGQADLVNVAGQASFLQGSMLALNLLPGTSLQMGDTFNLLLAQSLDGLQNLGLTGLNLASGLVDNLADVSIDGGQHALQLSIGPAAASGVPEPDDLGLLLIGIGIIASLVAVRGRRAGSAAGL